MKIVSLDHLKQTDDADRVFIIAEAGGGDALDEMDAIQSASSYAIPSGHCQDLHDPNARMSTSFRWTQIAGSADRFPLCCRA